MKLTTLKLMTMTAILTLASTALADKQDLRLLSLMEEAGANGEQFMSQWHVAVSGIECAFTVQTKTYECTMTDESADENGNTGKQLSIKGKTAKKFFEILVKLGAETDNGMGRLFVSGQRVYCKQAVEGVMDGSAAEHTVCEVDLKPAK